jgi:hypothetical protein
VSSDQVSAYRPDPVTQRDGSSLANSNCRCASIATGIDYETRGASSSSGKAMRGYMDDQSGGTSSSDARQAWSRGYSRSLTVRDGSTFDQLLADLRAGRLVHIDVWHASVGSAAGICLSGSGAYGHTMAVLPDCLDGAWLVADPWCNPPKWGRVTEAALRRGAEEWGSQVYGTALMAADYPSGGPGPRDPRVLAIVERVARRLMTEAYPGGPAGALDFVPETGGGQPVLFTVTAAIDPEVDMDVPVENSSPMLVDVPAGADILDLDGSKRLENSGDRIGVYSPFASRTPGGTATRAIVWTRPNPDPDLLLAAYGNQLENVRPLETGAGGDVDAALADRDAQWIDSLTEAWPAKP